MRAGVLLRDAVDASPVTFGAKRPSARVQINTQGKLGASFMMPVDSLGLFDPERCLQSSGGTAS